MNKRLPSQFDASRPLVARRFFPAHDMNFEPGEPVKLTKLGDEREDGTIETDTAMRLWLVGYLDYDADYLPTPAETAQQEAARLVKLEDLGGGWFLITTPWGGEGEKVQGKDAAEERLAAIIAKGDTKGVTVTDTGNGWYEVSAPWEDEPRKVHGQEAAAVEEAMLIQDGPPEGWKPETAEEKADRLQEAADRQAAQEQAEADRIAAEEKAAQEAKEAAEREAQEKADAEAAAAHAAALEAAGIVVTAKGGGYYEVSSPALSEPVKVRGKEAADAKVAELLSFGSSLDENTQQETEQQSDQDDATDQNAAQEGEEADQGEGAGEGATAEAPAEGIAQDKAEGEA